MKKFAVKKVYIFFSSLFVFCLHIPFVFAKAKPVGSTVGIKANTYTYTLADFKFWKAIGDSTFTETIYDSLNLGSLGLARQAFDYAIKGFDIMKAEGELVNENIISIIDFSKPSSKKRLFVIDLAHSKLLFNTYVAHGMHSGREFAKQFSNKPESFKSSLGFYETLGTYIGGNGYSLRLEGVEKGINDNANKRDIVIHGADYVNEKMIRSKGYIGRSWGCPALPERLHKSIIDVIKNGTGLFIFSPDNNYLTHSPILNQSSRQLLAMNK